MRSAHDVMRPGMKTTRDTKPKPQPSIVMAVLDFLCTTSLFCIGIIHTHSDVTHKLTPRHLVCLKQSLTCKYLV